MNLITLFFKNLTFRLDSNEILQTRVSSLPIDIWRHIFSFLSPWDICKLKLTCKEWKQIASDNLTWKKLFEEKFKLPEPTEEPNDVNWEKRYLDAQKAFCEPKSLQFKEVGTVEIERAGYSYKEGPWLLTTSYSWLINETVCKVWNLESKESIIEILIDSWNKPIMDKGKLFFGINNRIKILDIEKMASNKNTDVSSDKIVYQSTIEAELMKINGSSLVYTDKTNAVEIMDLKKQKIWTYTNQTNSHKSKISNLQIENNLLSFLVKDEKWALLIYDLTKNCLIEVIEVKAGLHFEVFSRWVAFKHDILVTEDGSDLDKIEVFNIRTRNKFIINKNEGFCKKLDNPTRLIKHNQNYLVIVERTDYAKIWGIKDGKPKGVLSFPPSESIEKIILKDHMLITKSKSRTLAIWDLKTLKALTVHSLPTEIKYMYLTDDQLVVHLRDSIVILQIESKPCTKQESF